MYAAPHRTLYGSDALGGVVSFQTKDPSDYLVGKNSYFKVKAGFDQKNDGSNLGLTSAFRSNRMAFLIQGTRRDGKAYDNQGEIDSLDQDRTHPNDIDSQSTQILFKIRIQPIGKQQTGVQCGNLRQSN